MRLRQSNWLLFGVLAAIAFVPTEAAAQQICGFCSDYFDEEHNDWVHEFGQDGAWFHCEGPGSTGCHYEPYFDYCGDFHNAGCTLGSLDLMEQLRDRIESGDYAGLLALLHENPTRIAFDALRMEYTVLGCRGDPFGAVSFVPTTTSAARLFPARRAESD